MLDKKSCEKGGRLVMMLEQKTVEFLEALSSGAPVPGGGGASALAGALALGMPLEEAAARLGG